MLGLILCGGESTRMGRDKGLLGASDNWAQAAAKKMHSLGIKVKISVNTNQLAAYSNFFNDAELIGDDPSLSVRGPLLGVLSAYKLSPEEDVFALACDMPFMESSILKELLEQYHQSSNAEAFVFTTNGEPEPLCGIYTAKGLSRILALLQQGQLKRHSMKYMLEQLNTCMVPAADDQKNYFRNMNAHADLNGL